MSRRHYVITITIALLLFILPFTWYPLGTLHGGGDDTKLYYLFPWEWITNFSLHTWNALSSFAGYGQNSYTIGTVLLLGLMGLVLPDYFVQPFAYGVILSGSFLTVVGVVRLLVRAYLQDSLDHDAVFFAGVIGGLFYVLSPILFYTEWQVQLLALFGVFSYPLLFYLFLRAYVDNRLAYIFCGGIASVIFSASIFALPWFFAFLIGLLLFGIIHVLVAREKKRFLKYVALAISTLLLFNSYWIISTLLPLLERSPGNFSTTILELGTRGTQDRLVTAVATGNSIIYPFLNLFHKSIQVNFNWPTKATFLSWNEPLRSLNSVFLLIIFTALLVPTVRRRDQTALRLGLLYGSLLIPMMVLLYFFTVNIDGWGLPLFLWMTEHIPGWVMFRNFYGKFTISYSFFYALVVSVSLCVVFTAMRKSWQRIGVSMMIAILILVHSWPFLSGRVINQPVWKTDSIYVDAIIPKDYLQITEYIKQQPDDVRYLNLPLNIAQYLIIRSGGQYPDNVYAGVSPLKILTGKDDFSGSMSFENPYIKELSKNLSYYIEKGEYEKLRKTLYLLNIRYILLVNNIPPKIERSYLYNPELLTAQRNEQFIQEMFGRLIISRGDFSLYEVNLPIFNEHIRLVHESDKYYTFYDLLDQSWDRLDRKTFIPDQFRQEDQSSYRPTKPSYSVRKINQTKYVITVNELDYSAEQTFLVLTDSFHRHWRIYRADVLDQQQTRYNPFVFSDIKYLWRKPLDNPDKHVVGNGYNNTWDVSNLIGNGVVRELVLVFKPQAYFYVTLLVSLLSVVVFASLLGYRFLRSRIRYLFFYFVKKRYEKPGARYRCLPSDYMDPKQ